MKRTKYFRVDGIDNVWFSVNQHELVKAGSEEVPKYDVWVEVVNPNFCYGSGNTEEEAAIAALHELHVRFAQLASIALDEYARRSQANFLGQVRQGLAKE